MIHPTRKSLLQKVVQGNEFSWAEFYSTYTPLIRCRGKDFYLNDSELEELVQVVMLEFAQKELIGKKFDMDHIPEGLSISYDKTKGRFRDFLRAVVTNHALKILNSRKKNLSSEDEQDADAFADQNDRLEKAWEQEWKDHILAQAMSELREQVAPKNYQAFEMLTLQEKKAKEVASILNISEDSVYQAKHRCMVILKSIIAELEELA